MIVFTFQTLKQAWREYLEIDYPEKQSLLQAKIEAWENYIKQRKFLIPSGTFYTPATGRWTFQEAVPEVTRPPGRPRVMGNGQNPC